MKILDTTLRDGEQMPGVVFDKKQKIELAKKISDFGVDFIDLMPAVSRTEREVAEYLVDNGLREKVLASTKMDEESIDMIKQIGLRGIFLITPLSDIHLQKRLRTTRQKNLEKALRYIEYARSQGLSVNLAGEDASRADIDYVIDFTNTLNRGIDYFFPCDTLGILTPRQTYDFIKRLKQETDCKIGLHIHNDFGQATANTLAGIEAGADLFSGTFTGIGERSGNAPIEEIVMALRFQYGKTLPLDYKSLGEICDLVEEYSEVRSQRHKPISGENAFSHESGIHVDGVLKSPDNYENFNPRVIGRKRRILFGKHSGTCGLRYLFGDRFSDEQYAEMLQVIKLKSESERTAFSEEEVREMFV